MVLALKIEPGKNPWPTMLCDDEDFLNCAVSLGSEFPFLVSARRLEPGVAIIYGHGAAMLDGTGNRRINGRIYVSTVYIVGHNNGRLVSLSEDVLTRYMSLYWNPEEFSEDELVDDFLLGDS